MTFTRVAKPTSLYEIVSQLMRTKNYKFLLSGSKPPIPPEGPFVRKATSFFFDFAILLDFHDMSMTEYHGFPRSFTRYLKHGNMATNLGVHTRLRLRCDRLGLGLITAGTAAGHSRHSMGRDDLEDGGMGPWFKPK